MQHYRAVFERVVGETDDNAYPSEAGTDETTRGTRETRVD